MSKANSHPQCGWDLSNLVKTFRDKKTGVPWQGSDSASRLPLGSRPQRHFLLEFPSSWPALQILAMSDPTTVSQLPKINIFLFLFSLLFSYTYILSVLFLWKTLTNRETKEQGKIMIILHNPEVTHRFIFLTVGGRL